MQITPTRIRKYIVTGFVALSVISLLIVMPDAINYAEFYGATASFEFTVTKIKTDISSLQTGIVLVMLEFNLSNPTPFNGLKFYSVNCMLRHSIFANWLDGGSNVGGINQQISPPIQIGPYGSATLKLNRTFVGQTDETVRNFIGYLQSNPSEIFWMVQGKYVLEAYDSMISQDISLNPYVETLA